MSEPSLDLGSVISALGNDPKTLSAIAGLMEMMKTPKDRTEVRSESGGGAPDADKLAGLLGTLSQSLGNNAQSNGRGPRDGRSAPLSGIFGSKEEVRCRIALLSALKPYLSESRCERLETVIKLLKLSELGELSRLTGLLNGI